MIRVRRVRFPKEFESITVVNLYRILDWNIGTSGVLPNKKNAELYNNFGNKSIYYVFAITRCDLSVSDNQYYYYFYPEI